MFKRSVGKLLLVVGVVITLSLSTMSFAQAGTILGAIYDNTASGWSYSAGWRVDAREGLILGTQHLSETAGSVATFNSCVPDIWDLGEFGSYRITLYHSAAYNRGIAKVALLQNGQLKTEWNVDQYGPGVTRQQKAEVQGYGFQPDLPVQVRVTVTGTRNGVSEGVFVDIDAIECYEYNP
jgi:hypothetical protein